MKETINNSSAQNSTEGSSQLLGDMKQQLKFIKGNLLFLNEIAEPQKVVKTHRQDGKENLQKWNIPLMKLMTENSFPANSQLKLKNRKRMSCSKESTKKINMKLLLK